MEILRPGLLAVHPQYRHSSVDLLRLCSLQLDSLQQLELLLIYFLTIEAIKDDPFNSHKLDLDLRGNEVKSANQNGGKLETEFSKIPIVDLPLGATEDLV
jgi:hypothetical protein